VTTLFDQRYAQVLAQTFASPKSVTEEIRAEQAAWLTYRQHKCRLQTMSNPRTYDALETACLARETFDRLQEVSGRLGADWTPY